VALREINLIPSEVMAARTMTRHLSFWAACLVAALGVVLGFYVVERYRINLERQWLMGMKNVPGQLTMAVDLQKRLQGHLDKLNQQKTMATAVKAKGVPVAPVIARLSQLMNDETWLTQLTMEAVEGQKEMRLLLTGFSASNERLGDFLNRLAADGSFKAVVLQFAGESDKEAPGQKRVQGRIRFNIGCQVR
jgi:Tfp pilus assembly protein PilN